MGCIVIYMACMRGVYVLIKHSSCLSDTAGKGPAVSTASLQKDTAGKGPAVSTASLQQSPMLLPEPPSSEILVAYSTKIVNFAYFIFACF